LNSVSSTFLITLIVLLVLFSAFFSATETGMMALNRYRLRHRVSRHDKRAKQITTLLKRPDRLLGVILIGNTVTNIIAASLTTILGLKLLGDVGALIATVLLTLSILLFGEIAPKTLAALHPERVAYFSIYPIRIIFWAFYPAVWLLSTLSNALLKILGVNHKDSKNEQLSQEELRTLVHEAAPLLPESDRNMLVGVLDLRAMTVDDIMVPRADIVGIDLAEDWEDIIEDLHHYQHTRLPIYENDINQVRGIIHVRTILQLMAVEELSKETLIKMADKIYFIPEGTPLTTQLMNFQINKCRIGLVVDEYGDIEGLVTLEDILEEVIGEFTTDIAQTHVDIHPEGGGSYIVDGSASVRELNRDMHWNLPIDGPKTLSGLIIEYLEVIPERPVCLRIAGYPMEIVKIQDNTVKAVRIYPLLK
jgi:Mg2+/Co2+ transporter CorB